MGCSGWRHSGAGDACTRASATRAETARVRASSSRGSNTRSLRWASGRACPRPVTRAGECRTGARSCALARHLRGRARIDRAVRLRVADHAVRVNGQQFPLLLRPAIPAVKLRPPALGAREDWYLVEWRGLRQGRWASHSVIASCVFLRLIAASSAGKLARWPRVGSVPARPGR